MLLRSSISNTKKFFQKTLHNFMSFFSPGYQKLPKTPPHNHFPSINMDNNNNNQNYKDLDKFYSDFTKQWDSEKENTRRRRNKKKANLSLSSQPKQENDNVHNEDQKKNDDHEMEKIDQERDDEKQKNIKRSLLTHQKGIIRQQEDSSSLKLMNYSKGNGGMVEKKLREMEMLDMSNVDYILDIEQVLHYYSRLTCPAYLEIVDKFFLEIYSEFFGGTVVPCTPTVNSRMKLRSTRS